MSAVQSLEAARAILGSDLLGPDEVASAFGVSAAAVVAHRISFSQAELMAAREAQEMLVLRVAHAAVGAPLTILHMVQRYHTAFDEKLLRKVGYQLKDEWGIELEPAAATDTCTDGWALVRKSILEESCNLTYEEQAACLHQYAERRGLRGDAIRRRSAVEAVYDTLLYFTARQRRLLERTWDWTATRTVDGGYLNVGGFGSNGMQVLSFSRAVRHGALGVCPTWQPMI